MLTPDWLRERAVGELGLDGERVHAFPMEGRLPNEWEAPLDFGQVKMGIGVGPLDRLILFVGPLEHAAGVDILLEALPVAAAARAATCAWPSSAAGTCTATSNTAPISWASAMPCASWATSGAAG